MSASLPARPDLGQLRRQAKELRDSAHRGEPGALDRVSRNYRPASEGPLTLAAAQLVIARELGFASWPRLKAAVEARGWPPLLYACYSRWHQIDPARTAGMAEAVRLLLGAGASPNTNNGARRGYRSALTGSVEVNNPAITQVLLDAGANPDDGKCIGEAARHRDHRCLELLISHGAQVAGTWALGAAVYADDPQAVSLLLDAIGSLLHPQVRWTGLCNTSAQVLDWYRQSLADGTRPVVESVEADRDAVVLGITVTRPAEQARPAPAERLYQVFTVANGDVVEIRGYPDRASALARTPPDTEAAEHGRAGRAANP